MSDQQTRTPVLDQLYHRYLLDENTAGFIRSISQRYSIGTLERLAGGGGRNTRRGAVMALGFLGRFDSNAVLGKALWDEDRGVRLLAENGIRSLWRRDGDISQQQRLGQIIHLNVTRRYHEALRKASELSKEAPWFAEIWNQKAIAQFHLQSYELSIRDCRQALEINCYHFAAAAGMGQCYLEKGEMAEALESLERALKLNPALENVRVQVQKLHKVMGGE